MKHQGIYLTLVVFFVSLASCKKDTTPNPIIISQSAKIKSITTQQTSIIQHLSYYKTENLFYDTSGRIILIADSANSGNKVVYSYESNRQVTVDEYSSDVLQVHGLIFFNNNSQEDSVYYYNIKGDTTWDKFTYNYNSNNRIVNAKDVRVLSDTFGIHSKDTTNINYTNDANDNIASIKVGDSTTIFTYYANITYSAPLYTSPIKFYRGNYIKTEIISGIVTNFSYTFDSQNRLITFTQAVPTVNTTIVTTYTYY